MKSKRSAFLAGTLLALVCLTALGIRVIRRSGDSASPAQNGGSRLAPRPEEAPILESADLPNESSTAVAPEAPTLEAIRQLARRSSSPSVSKSKEGTGAAAQLDSSLPPMDGPGPNAQPREQIGDPLAREALGWVGIDPTAEEYWIEAINDPALSAAERANLIEDLNEDGLSDPDDPTVDDLPLIMSRLQLLEELSPFAMDEVNADAFAEAYKDLANMYARLTN
jgi:hypothetical protein